MTNEEGPRKTVRSEGSIFGGLPKEWTSSHLQNTDLFTVRSSGVEEFSGPKTYLSTGCVEGLRVVDNEGEITRDDRPSRANLQPEEEAVCFAKMSDSKKVLRIDKDLENDVILSTGFVHVNPSKEISSEYLKQVVASERFERLKSSLAIGSTQPAITNSDLAGLRIPIPPIGEQRRIASILQNIDLTLRKTRRISARKDKLLRGAMSQLFTDGARSHDAHQEAPTGRFPAEWGIQNLEEIVTRNISYGILKPGQYDPDGTIMVKAKDIDRGRFRESDPMRVEESVAEDFERTKLEEGDVLLSVMGTVGRSMVVPERLDGGNVNRALAVLRIDESHLLPEFLDFWFRGSKLQSYFETQKYGTAQPRLNISFLNKMKVPLPPRGEQERIVEMLTALDQSYWNEVEQKDRLARLKRGLQQDLLSGEIRTHDKPIDVLTDVKQHG